MKSLRIGAIVVCACVFLGACTPGTNEVGAARPPAQAAKPRMAQAVQTGTEPRPQLPITRDEFLAWAEAAYPALFHGTSQEGTAYVYDYRHYPATGHYIGFHDDNVFLLGPASNGVLTFLGHIMDFACTIRPGDCAVDRPRTPMQVLWDAIGASPGGYSIFMADVPRTPSSWFYATYRMPTSPRASADARAWSQVVSTHAAVNYPAVPAAFAACAAPWFRIILDERGEPAKLCDNGPIRFQYFGDTILATRVSSEGHTVVRYHVSAVTEEAIDGRVITLYLRDTLREQHPWYSLNDTNPRFPESSRGGTAFARRINGLVFFFNADGSEAASVEQLVPLDKTGFPGTPAATLEDVFGPLPADGVMVVNGRRARFEDDPSPAMNPGAIEIDGRVYRAKYQFAEKVDQAFLVYLNAFARDGLLIRGLVWPPS